MVSANYHEQRAARVLRVIDGAEVLYAENLAPDKHGTWNGYSNHGCECLPCKLAGTAYATARRPKRGTRPKGERHPCALPGCGRVVRWPPGVPETRYRETRYCSPECRNAGRARAVTKVRAFAERECACGCGVRFTPQRRNKQRYATQQCSARGAGRIRAAQMRAERVAGDTREEEIERAAREAARKQADRERKARAARDRKPAVETAPPVRFGQTPTVKRGEPVEKTTRPRPSFGLTRRSA